MKNENVPFSDEKSDYYWMLVKKAEKEELSAIKSADFTTVVQPIIDPHKYCTICGRMLRINTRSDTCFRPECLKQGRIAEKLKQYEKTTVQQVS